jgi:hypothetical protein
MHTYVHPIYMFWFYKKRSPHGSIEVFVKTANGKTVNLVDVLPGDIITVEALDKLTADTAVPPTSGNTSTALTTTTSSSANNNNNNNNSNASASSFKSTRLPLQPFMSGMDTTTKEVEMNNVKTNNNNNTQSKSFDGSCGGGGGGGIECGEQTSTTFDGSCGGGGEVVVKETEVVPPTASPSAELPLWASSRDIQPVNENEEKKSFEKM